MQIRKTTTLITLFSLASLKCSRALEGKSSCHTYIPNQTGEPIKNERVNYMVLRIKDQGIRKNVAQRTKGRKLLCPIPPFNIARMHKEQRGT